MPRLTSMTKAHEPKSFIMYGPSLGGKTSLATSLAKGMKVLFVDGENGSSVLLNHPKSWHKNIFVLKVRDTKDTPNYITTCLMLASGKKVQVCEKHGIVMNSKPVITPCTECMKAYTAARASGDEAAVTALISEWTLNDMSPDEWVIVFDSFTQLTSSANAKVCEKLDESKMEFEEFKHWRAQGKLLEKFLDYVQSPAYNCIVIGHEDGIKQVDGTEKIIPAGGTTNFGRKVGRYFGGGSIYCGVKNKKHIVLCNTTDDTRIAAGVRGGHTIDLTSPDTRANGMLALFGK